MLLAPSLLHSWWTPGPQPADPAASHLASKRGTQGSPTTDVSSQNLED